jgi:hypothetical protein
MYSAQREPNVLTTKLLNYVTPDFPFPFPLFKISSQSLHTVRINFTASFEKLLRGAAETFLRKKLIGIKNLKPFPRVFSRSLGNNSCEKTGTTPKEYRPRGSDTDGLLYSPSRVLIVQKPPLCTKERRVG